MKKLPTEMTLEEKILYGFKIINTNPKLRTMVNYLRKVALYDEGDIKSLIYDAIVKTEKKMLEVYVWFKLFPLMLLNVIGDEMRREARFYFNTVPMEDINEFEIDYWLGHDNNFVDNWIKEEENKEIIEKNTLFGISVYKNNRNYRDKNNNS